MKRTPSPHRIASLIVSILLALVTTAVQATIPPSEQTALRDLYTDTNGAKWTISTYWNGTAGSECTWYGVTCNGIGTTVTGIDLNSNNLTGTLPASLNTLTNLFIFDVHNNKLTVSIPALTGLTILFAFNVSSNQLTGNIPPLDPASTGLMNLQYFYVNNNQLTGTIPALTGLTNLKNFFVYDNQLTGSIPTLNPALTGLTNLQSFAVNNNHLTGTIPAFTGLTNLQSLHVDDNQLTGTIPALTGLTKLQFFFVGNNRLTGNVPSVPTPDALVAGGSGFCPNALNRTPDAAWDAATGEIPWYTNCHPLNLVPILELLLLD